MSEDVTFLPAGPVAALEDVHIISGGGRVGDGLVYAARQSARARQLRLREYAPPGIVERAASGLLIIREPRFATAWMEGVKRFDEQARNLLDLSRGPAIETSDGRETNPLPTVWAAARGLIATSPPGESIAQLLAAGGNFTPAEVRELAIDLASALAFVHGAGLTHLALSPETVARGAGGVQLTDFTVDFRPYLLLLGASEGFVRRGYGSIEMLEADSDQPLPPATDIYAASALVYRLMTGADPAPWDDRRRDIGAGLAAVAADYDPAFVDAVRRGLAIEPADRPADGTAWHAALATVTAAAPADGTAWHAALATVTAAAPIAPMIVAPAAPPLSLEKAEPTEVTAPVIPIPAEPLPPIPDAPPAPSPPVDPTTGKSGAGWLAPAAIGLLVGGAVVAGGVVALSGQLWPQANNIQVAPPPSPPPPPPPSSPPPPPPPAEPEIQVGGRVAGTLASGDRMSDSRQYEDVYRLSGRRGQALEINLTASEFDPILTLRGPGGQFEQNDDIDFPSNRNSRITVTLERDGVYELSVSAYADPGTSDPPSTGRYTLDVRDPSVTTRVDQPTPARGLVGRWRLSDDPQCRSPQVIALTESGFTASFGNQRFTHRVNGGANGEVETVITDTNLSGRMYRYRIAPDGNSFAVEDETWIRCSG